MQQVVIGSSVSTEDALSWIAPEEGIPDLAVIQAFLIYVMSSNAGHVSLMQTLKTFV